MASAVTARRIVEIGAILLLLYASVMASDTPDFESDCDSYERPHMWSSLLEEWATKYVTQLHNFSPKAYAVRAFGWIKKNVISISGSSPSTRQGRVMQMAHRYIPTSNMYITKRIGNVSPLSSSNQNINLNGNAYQRISQNGPSEVSETDLYLLGAIEKLVYRVDYMEKRLLKSEQLIYYLMAGNNQNRKEIDGEWDRDSQKRRVVYHLSRNMCFNFLFSLCFCFFFLSLICIPRTQRTHVPRISHESVTIAISLPSNIRAWIGKRQTICVDRTAHNWLSWKRWMSTTTSSPTYWTITIWMITIISGWVAWIQAYYGSGLVQRVP